MQAPASCVAGKGTLIMQSWRMVVLKMPSTGRTLIASRAAECECDFRPRLTFSALFSSCVSTIASLKTLLIQLFIVTEVDGIVVFCVLFILLCTTEQGELTALLWFRTLFSLKSLHSSEHRTSELPLQVCSAPGLGGWTDGLSWELFALQVLELYICPQAPPKGARTENTLVYFTKVGTNMFGTKTS